MKQILAGNVNDCLFPDALKKLTDLGHSLVRSANPSNYGYERRESAKQYAKAVPYARQAYTGLLNAKSKEQALQAMDLLKPHVRSVDLNFCNRIIDLIKARKL